MEKQQELRIRILDAAAELFNRKGMKFTMDDLAHELGMSKKTIYTVFEDKMSLCDATVDYFFDSIDDWEKVILNDPNLSITEKIRGALCVIPDRYEHIDLRQLYVLKDKYPKVYKHVQRRLATDWEATYALIKKGIEEGELRPISIPIFRAMINAAIEQFLQQDILLRNDISYHEALAEVASILVDGIRAPRAKK